MITEKQKNNLLNSIRNHKFSFVDNATEIFRVMGWTWQDSTVPPTHAEIVATYDYLTKMIIKDVEKNNYTKKRTLHFETGRIAFIVNLDAYDVDVYLNILD